MVKQEFIICAAIYYDDGEKYAHQPINIEHGIVICGKGHHNCIATLAGLKGWDNYDRRKLGFKSQGFLTSNDRFVSRQEGYIIALNAKQIEPRKENKELDELLGLGDLNTDILTSEDLYNKIPLLYSEDLYGNGK